jgi:AraC-like DNA-binding protein
MLFDFEERLSDSPFVEKVWRTETERSGPFTSLASSNWEMVISKYNGKINFTIRGPETKATPAYCHAGGEFLGIIFKIGTFMPLFPASNLLDRQDATLPDASSQSFWLNGSAWQFPDYENADTFVDRLMRNGLVVHDDVVDAVLQNRPQEFSIRSVRRRFLRATGLTPGYIYQIERARHAMTLLQQGVSILDTVYETGYFDQPHLTRSLKHLVGQTPAQIIRLHEPEPLSLLYKTEPAY